MAGDWIKMRSDLFTHPKVVRMASALKADKLRIVGGLMSVWCLFDAHSVDGELEGYNFAEVDDQLRWPGFSASMASIGWLAETENGLVLPEFDTHNGQSAKRRAQDADRKREVRKVSASDTDEKRTREEKRREERNTVPDGTGADGAADEQPTARDLVFANGVPLLTVAGVAEKNARSMLAGLCKRNGDAAVADAIAACAKARPVEPVSWLQAVLAGKAPASKQQAIEDRNRAVADAWVPPELRGTEPQEAH